MTKQPISISDTFIEKVKQFILKDLDFDTKVHLLVWTTTPWTLPSNLALAINKDIEYCAYICEESLQDKSVFIASMDYFNQIKGDKWLFGGFKFPLNSGGVDGHFRQGLLARIMLDYGKIKRSPLNDPLEQK